MGDIGRRVTNGSGIARANHMYYSVYQSCAAHFPDVTAGGGWLDRLRSLSLIADDGASDRIHTLGTIHGTHQGVRMYSAGDRVAEMDRHFYNLPPFAEDRTWIPQISAKIKNIRRDYVSAEDHYLTTVEVFNATDVDVTPPNPANNARRGNDQFLNGLKVGHLVHMRDNGGKDLSEDNENALLDFGPTTLSKYAVTAVGHVDGSGDFQDGPDGDGNLVACQYIDTDHANEREYTDLDVGQLNAGLWLDTTTGWMNFVYNLRAYRSMFLASTLPLSCWHGSEASGYWQAQQREYRLEVMFHGLLHGEQHRYWYNPQFEHIQQVDDPDGDDDALDDMENLTNAGLLEMGIACGVDVADISPLSLNYMRPSMRHTDHLVSGANIGDDKRLFRITLKDEELVTLDENNKPVVRLYDPLIGPIETVGTDHVDFRTFSGHMIRVPGQLIELNPASEFDVYGRWIVCEKPAL
jgi:hypothetical protein